MADLAVNAVMADLAIMASMAALDVLLVSAVGSASVGSIELPASNSVDSKQL
ncbi:MAG: hypothetical protein AB1847_19865 [bacterium]